MFIVFFFLCLGITFTGAMVDRNEWFSIPLIFGGLFGMISVMVLFP